MRWDQPRLPTHRDPDPAGPDPAVPAPGLKFSLGQGSGQLTLRDATLFGRTEWRLITATHNLLKLHRHALAAA